MRETETRIDEQLRSWGRRTEEYFKAKANDVKELLIVLARTSESLGERDQRYASQFSQFTSRLHAIADLEDLTQVRASLVQTATELKTHVDRMEEESHQSMAQLQQEISTYETKLKATEELALRDTLTGLANRRNVEERMAWRVAHQQTFCVAMLDINRFKQVNDRHGHPAGDNLLQQFSQELTANMRSTDLVGRWSGDEFIVVLDCDLASAVSQVEPHEAMGVRGLRHPARRRPGTDKDPGGRCRRGSAMAVGGKCAVIDRARRLCHVPGEENWASKDHPWQFGGLGEGIDCAEAMAE